MTISIGADQPPSTTSEVLTEAEQLAAQVEQYLGKFGMKAHDEAGMFTAPTLRHMQTDQMNLDKDFATKSQEEKMEAMKLQNRQYDPFLEAIFPHDLTIQVIALPCVYSMMSYLFEFLCYIR